MFQKDKLYFQPIPLPYRASKSNKEIRLGADAFYAATKQRHTVRDYSTQPVELSVIQTCIKAAGLAPSGANHQPWHFVAISNVEIKHQIREAAEEEERQFYSGGVEEKSGSKHLNLLALVPPNPIWRTPRG